LWETNIGFRVLGCFHHIGYLTRQNELHNFELMNAIGLFHQGIPCHDLFQWKSWRKLKGNISTMKPNETIWNNMKQYETIWNNVKQCVTMWNNVKQYVHTYVEIGVSIFTTNLKEVCWNSLPSELRVVKSNPPFDKNNVLEIREIFLADVNPKLLLYLHTYQVRFCSSILSSPSPPISLDRGALSGSTCSVHHFSCMCVCCVHDQKETVGNDEGFMTPKSYD
jgi:hypothetical protein